MSKMIMMMNDSNNTSIIHTSLKFKRAIFKQGISRIKVVPKC